MAEWTCRCSAKNAEGSRYCEGCGGENPKPPDRALTTPPKVPETHAPWTPPTYPAPTPEDDALIRLERAKLHAAAWWRDTPGTARRPAVDPAIRAETERRNAAGPAPVGAVVADVLAKAAR